MPNFTNSLRATIDQACQESIHHPFIDQLSSGRLPQATFRYYLIQDNHYLTAFNRLHQLIATHLPADDATTLRHLGEGEDQARQKMHQEIGLDAQELTATPPAPNCYAYVSHMYFQLSQYGTAPAAAGLLPCYWLYGEIGRRLAAKHSPVALYQEFFDSYAAADFQDSTAKMKAIVNRQAADSSPVVQEQMRRAFNISCYYEKQFWQMAFTRQEW